MDSPDEANMAVRGGKNAQERIGHLLTPDTEAVQLLIADSNLEDEDANLLGLFLESNQTVLVVDASSNKITGVGFRAVCNGLEKNHTVTQLDASNNELDSFASESIAALLGDATPTKLKILNLASNNLGNASASSIGLVMPTEKHLQILNLANNGITSLGATNLFTGIGVNDTLTELDISSNNLSNTAMPLLAEALLQPHNRLNNICLANTHIGDKGIIALAPALAKPNCKIEVFDLSNNTISDSGATELATVLRTNTSVEALLLHRNAIGDPGLTALATALAVPTSKVSEFTFSKNFVSHAGAIAIRSLVSAKPLKIDEPRVLNLCAVSAASVSDALDWLFDIEVRPFVGVPRLIESGQGTFTAVSTARDLKVLDLSRCGLDSTSAIPLFHMLAQHPNIVAVSLAHNEIGDNGLTALAEHVQLSSDFSHLDLSHNSFGELGLWALARSLAKRKRILSLNVGGNSIGDEGVMALAWLVERLPCLQSLRLSAMDLQPNHIQVLAPAIQQGNSLKLLDVSGNALKPAHTEEVAKLVKSVRSLSHLDVADCRLGATSLETLFSLIDNGELLYLNISHNLVPMTSLASLTGALGSDTCILRCLRLQNCGLDDSFASDLVKAASQPSSSLVELSLQYNILTGGMVQTLASTIKASPDLQLLVTPGFTKDDVVEAAAPLTFERNDLTNDSGTWPKIASDGPPTDKLPRRRNVRFADNTKEEEFREMLRKPGELLRVTRAELSATPKRLKVVEDRCLTDTSLRFVRINNSDLTDDALIAVLSSLSNNKSFTNLHEVSIEDEVLLTHIGLSRLCDVLSNAFSLFKLSLNGTRLNTAQAASAVAGLLVAHTRLEELSLCNCGITLDSLQHIADGVFQNTSLKRLLLGSNRIDDVGGFVVAQVLTHNTSLLHVDLSHNQLTDIGCRGILESVAEHPSLTHLTLTGNPVKRWTFASLNETAPHITTGLGGPASTPSGSVSGSLTRSIYRKGTEQATLAQLLNVRNLSPDHAQFLAPLFHSPVKLTELTAAHKNLNDTAALVLSDLIRHNEGIRRVNLTMNRIGQRGASSLADSFAGHPLLGTVDLSLNKIPDAGVSSLARSLEKCPNLTALDLSGNKVTDQGMQSIAKLIRGANGLYKLGLAANSITASGASVLCDALLGVSTTSAIAVIRVTGNAIGDDGARAFASWIKKSVAVQEVHLSQCRIGDNGVHALARAFPSCPTLRKLLLSSNLIQDDGADALARAALALAKPSAAPAQENSPLLLAAFPSSPGLQPVMQQVLVIDVRQNYITPNAADKLATSSARVMFEGAGDQLDPQLMSQRDSAGDRASVKALARPLSGEAPEATALRTRLLAMRNNYVLQWSAFHGQAVTLFPKVFNSVLTKSNLAHTCLLRSNSIDDPTVAALIVDLRENDKLTELDLSDNKITDEGVRILCQAIAGTMGDNWNGARFSKCRISNLKLGANLLSTQALVHLSYLLPKPSDEVLAQLKSGAQAHSRLSIRSISLAPSDGGSLPLQTLDVSDNFIGDDGVVNLKQALIRNASLTSLVLRDNGITERGWSSLAQALKSNTTLVHLDMSNNPLGPEGAAVFVPLLDNNEALVHLHINGCEFGDEGAKLIRDAMRASRVLVEIHLRDNNLSPVGVASVTEGICANGFLKRISLGGKNNHSRATIRELIRIAALLDAELDKLPAPKSETVSERMLEDISKLVAPLYASAEEDDDDANAPLKSHRPVEAETTPEQSVSELWENQLKNALQAQPVRAEEVNSFELQQLHINRKLLPRLTQTMASTSSPIHNLVLADNSLDDACVASLCQAMAENLVAFSQLRTLNLSSNSLSDLSCAHLARLFRQGVSSQPQTSLSSLETLELRDNWISATGVALICAALMSSFTNSGKFKCIDLSENNISGSLDAMATLVLSPASTLEVLDVSGNRIGDDGAKNLAKAVSSSPALKILRLSRNLVTDAGGQALAVALCNSESVAELWLDSNHLTDTTLEAFEHATKRLADQGHEPKAVYLERNKFSATAFNAAKTRTAALELGESHTVNDEQSPATLIDVHLSEDILRAIQLPLDLAFLRTSGSTTLKWDLAYLGLPENAVESIVSRSPNKATVVDLSGNIAFDVPVLPSIQDLSLCDCRMDSSIGAQVANLCSRLPHLTSLDLSRNPLGSGSDGGAGQALFALSRHPTLKTLRLVDVQLTAQCIETAAKLASESLAELNACPFETLELSCNPLGNEGVAVLANGAGGRFIGSVVDLRLDNCRIGASFSPSAEPYDASAAKPGTDKSTGAHLASLVRAAPLISVLCLAENAIDDSACGPLLESVCDLSVGLGWLDLTFNRITAGVASHLTTKVLSRIDSLVLSCNPCGDAVLKALYDGLVHEEEEHARSGVWPAFSLPRVVRLDYCGVTDASVSKILPKFSKASSLSTISLSGNALAAATWRELYGKTQALMIDVQGFPSSESLVLPPLAPPHHLPHLLEVLQANEHSLSTVLDLVGIELGSHEVEAVERWLMHHTHVTSLKLSNTKLTDKLVSEILRTLLRGTHVTHLDLSDNPNVTHITCERVKSLFTKQRGPNKATFLPRRSSVYTALVGGDADTRKNAIATGSNPLASLHLCNCGNVGASGLAALIECNAVDDIYVDGCKIDMFLPADDDDDGDGDDPVSLQERLVSALSHVSTLHGLSLKGCGIGNKGLEALAPALRSASCSLKRLNLADNGITDDSLPLVRDLFNPAAKGGFRLQSLDLGSNRLTDRFALSLVPLIGRHDTLEELVLDRSCVTPYALHLVSTELLRAAHLRDLHEREAAKQQEKLKLKHTNGLAAAAANSNMAQVPPTPVVSEEGDNDNLNKSKSWLSGLRDAVAVSLDQVTSFIEPFGGSGAGDKLQAMMIADIERSFAEHEGGSVNLSGKLPGKLATAGLNMVVDCLYAQTNGQFGAWDLEHIDLSDNHLEDSQEVDKILLSLEMHRTLISIDLSKNRLGAHTAQQLAQLADVLPNLHQVNLSSNEINDAGIAHLRKMYLVSKTISKLQLSANHFTAEGVKLICEVVTSNPHVTELDLSHNRVALGGGRDADGPNALAAALASHHCQLRILRVGSCELGDDACATIVTPLATSQGTVEVLSLEHNNLSSMSMKTIADMLSVNPTLHTLNVGHNPIGDQGAQALADGVATSTSLRQVIVTGCKMHAQGARALKKCMDLTDQRVEILGIPEVADTFRASAKMVPSRTGVELPPFSPSTVPPTPATSMESDVDQNADTESIMSAQRTHRFNHNFAQQLVTKLQQTDSRAAPASQRGATQAPPSARNEDIVDAEAEFKAVERYLASLRGAPHVNMANMNLTAEGVFALADYLSSRSTTLSLDVSENKIGDVGLKTIANALAQQNSSLQELRAGLNDIRNEGVVRLANSLRTNMALVKLSLALNPLELSALKNLCDTLTEVSHPMRELDLTHCCENYGAEAARVVGEMLTNPASCVVILHFGRNKCGNEGAKHFAAMLAVNTALSWLYLHDNEIGDEGATALATAVGSNRALKELKLTSNGITDVACKAFADELMPRQGHPVPQLRRLKLGDNRIGNDGAVALARTLQANWKLSGLYLASNLIDDDGAIKIAQCLDPSKLRSKVKRKGGVIEVSLQHNKIGDEGAKVLAAAVINPACRVSALHLEGNPIFKVGAEALSACVLARVGLGESADPSADRVPLFTDVNWTANNVTLPRPPTALPQAAAPTTATQDATDDADHFNLVRFLHNLNEPPVLEINDKTLSEDDLKTVAKFVSENHKLRVLELRNTQWTNDGLQHVLRACGHAAQLQGIDVRGGSENPSGPVLSALYSLAKYGNQLKTVHIDVPSHVGDVDIDSPTHDKGGETETELFLRLRRVLRFNNLLSACGSDEDRTLAAQQLAEFLPPARPGIGWVLRKRANLNPAAVAALAQRLTTLNPAQPLSLLNLDENMQIPMNAWAAIATALTINPGCVKAVSMQQNGLTDEFVKLFSPFVADTRSSLQRLNLSSNRITQVGMSALQGAISQNGILSELRVASNSFGLAGFGHLITALQTAAGKSRMQVLDVEECGLDDEAATRLSTLLSASNCALHDVYLGRNSITKVGAAALGSAFVNNSKLQHVRLAGCPIGDGGVTELCNLLSSAKHVRTVWFGACGLTDASSAALAEFIKTARSDGTHKELEEIWLGGNKLGDASAKQIAQVLRDPQTCTLKRIYLASNSLGVEGCVSLLAATESNPFVVSCTLTSNPGFSDQIRKDMDQTLKRNSEILANSIKQGVPIMTLFSQVSTS